jgi:YkoY family integral membrane protein
MLDFTPSDYLAMFLAIGWLVVLEGLLSADNALVLAVMVQHLPDNQQKKALRYGIWGAFIFRFIAVILASYLIRSWWIQVFGGFYLIFVAVRHFTGDGDSGVEGFKSKRGASFWGTVLNVELADIAFSVDSILAAVAMSEGLPDHLQYHQPVKLFIIYLGGILGIITMRFVAGAFLKILKRFPGLAIGAYILVAWIGMKLVGEGVHHAFHPEDKELLSTGWRTLVPDFIKTLPWEMPYPLFWGGMILIVIASIFQGRKIHPAAHEIEAIQELAEIEESPPGVGSEPAAVDQDEQGFSSPLGV